MRTWLLDLTRYDRDPALYPTEILELERIVAQWNAGHSQWYHMEQLALHRLLRPIRDVLDFTAATVQGAKRYPAHLLARNARAALLVLGMVTQRLERYCGV